VSKGLDHSESIAISQVYSIPFLVFVSAMPLESSHGFGPNFVACAFSDLD